MSKLEAKGDGSHEPIASFGGHDPAESSVLESEDPPGAKLGRIGLILAIIPLTAFLGLCCSILAMVLSRQVGAPNRKAVIGIVVAIAWLIVGVIVDNIFFNPGRS